MKAAVLLATAAHAAKQAVEEPAESPVACVPASKINIRLPARLGGRARRALGAAAERFHRAPAAARAPPRRSAARRPIIFAPRACGAATATAARRDRARRPPRPRPPRPPRPQPQTRRFLIDPVKEMVNKGIETATTGAGWLKGGPQMVSDVVCGIIDTWVSVIDPNEGTIRKAMSGDAATLDELASLASTIGSIVFVVCVA